jgi:hypothetical protein
MYSSVRRSEHGIQSNENVIRRLAIGKNVEYSGLGLVEDTVLA